MNKVSNIQSEMLDVLSRVERLNALEELHRSQPVPDLLALEGYKKLRQQYADQLVELLYTVDLKADIQLKAA